MTEYRRGNLKEAVLARAVEVLRDRGAGALSLRELARDLGVSHGAPARHFADRQQLIEELAVKGFDLLAAEIRRAVESGTGPEDQARRIAHAYVGFATADPNLVDVMYQHEGRRDAEVVGRSAYAAFEPLLEVWGGNDRAATLFLATLQGIAALVNCGVVRKEELTALIEDAVPRFVTPGP